MKASISKDMLHLSLKQLGATKITSSLSTVTIVKFELSENLTVSYFCYIKDEEKIYIQRIEPYPVRNYRFETIENIISFIKSDVALFENACKSHNFDLFLDMITKNFEVRKEVEEFFLSNNVPAELLEEFVQAEERLLQSILNAEHIRLDDVADKKYTGDEMKQKNTLESRIDKEQKAGKFVKDIYGEADIVHPAILSDMVTDIIEHNIREGLKDLKNELIEEITEKVAKRLKK